MDQKRKPLVIGVTGRAFDSAGRVSVLGAGKDTVADMLVARGMVKVALADEIKRTAQRLWPAFTWEHLWGPSARRDEPVEVAPGVWLTARHVCQQLGTEVGRTVDPDVWLRIVQRTAVVLAGYSSMTYEEMVGLTAPRKSAQYLTPHRGAARRGVVVSDIRFFNEAEFFKENGVLIRISRQVDQVRQAATDHQSEKEAVMLPDAYFHHVITNDSTQANLELKVAHLYDVLTGRLLAYDDAQADTPPGLRGD